MFESKLQAWFIKFRLLNLYFTITISVGLQQVKTKTNNGHLALKYFGGWTFFSKNLFPLGKIEMFTEMKIVKIKIGEK